MGRFVSGAIIPSVIVYFLYKLIYTSVNTSLASQDLSLISLNLFIPAMIGTFIRYRNLLRFFRPLI